MCPATDDNAAQGDLDQPECSGYLLSVPYASVGLTAEKAWAYNTEKGDYRMTDKEQIAMMIDIYTDLQRIANAADRDKEIRNQIKKARTKLEAFGVVVEDLKME